MPGFTNYRETADDGGDNNSIAVLLGLTDSVSPAARAALERYLSSFIAALPTSDAGLSVGKLWNNGGKIEQVGSAP